MSRVPDKFMGSHPAPVAACNTQAVPHIELLMHTAVMDLATLNVIKRSQLRKPTCHAVAAGAGAAAGGGGAAGTLCVRICLAAVR